MDRYVLSFPIWRESISVTEVKVIFPFTLCSDRVDLLSLPAHQDFSDELRFSTSEDWASDFSYFD